MKIVFTICSNNYLAQAKVFRDSLLKHNPQYTFFLGLVDRMDERVDYGWVGMDHVIPVDTLGIENFEALWKSMDIVEFNTCVKPSYFKYFCKKFPDVQSIMYFDPDICVYDALTDMESELASSDILLTPHILSPVPVDGNIPGENLFLNYGLYNLGFLGVKIPSGISSSFLDWWEERCLKMGYNRPQHGLFVDQLWINLAPLYYKKVAISRRHGYNMGPWNLHERSIVSLDGESIMLNDGKALVFYHFSSYSYKRPEHLSRFYNRIGFADSGLLKKLYDDYNDRLRGNRIDVLETIPCYYIVEKKKLEEQRPLKERIIRKTKDLILNFTPYYFVKSYRERRNSA